MVIAWKAWFGAILFSIIALCFYYLGNKLQNLSYFIIAIILLSFALFLSFTAIYYFLGY